MPNNFQSPVTRNNLFYSERDFAMEQEILCNYLEEDLNQTVVVYEVDRTRTNSDAVSKDSYKGIRYKTPKELPCMYQIDGSQMKSYDNASSNGAYSLGGSLTCYIPTEMFAKYNCDIKRGDYLGVQIDTNRMAYFVVNDDGKVNTANTSFMGALRPIGRIVKASPVTDTEFNGK